MSVRLVQVLGVLFGFGLSACAGPSATAPEPTAPVGATAPIPMARALPIAPQPDLDLREPGAILVHGTRVAFDGVEEGLAWPALDKALPARKPGELLTLQVGRGIPTIHLLRAAWTLRRADLQLQSLDASGIAHAVKLAARRDGPPGSGCHLAVFVRPDGTLRVASPGGPVVVGGDDPDASFARSLADESAKCAFKYVAFGAEADSAPFGPVFDVMIAVDATKAAGSARYVLGQAMHASPSAAVALP